MKAKKNIIAIFFIVILIFGVMYVNVNINRQIYSSVVNEYAYEDKNKTWDVDNMVDVFSNMNNNKSEYLKKEDNRLPKIRILFNLKPFDFRIDTNKYTFYINQDIVKKSPVKKVVNYIKENSTKLNGIIETIRSK